MLQRIPGEIAYGKKYSATSDLGTTEIAKLFRADVKVAIKAGELPKELKLSVKTSYYSCGSSIDVEIKTIPTSMKVHNPETLAFEFNNPHHNQYGMERYTAKAKALVEKLQAMLDAYNYDGSDSMTDYYHVRFSGRVEWYWILSQDDRAAQIAVLNANFEHRGDLVAVAADAASQDDAGAWGLAAVIVNNTPKLEVSPDRIGGVCERLIGYLKADRAALDAMVQEDA